MPEKERKKLHGVYLEPDSKRYYPNGTLAAQVIGFVNADNDGAYGGNDIYIFDGYTLLVFPSIEI